MFGFVEKVGKRTRKPAGGFIVQLFVIFLLTAAVQASQQYAEVSLQSGSITAVPLSPDFTYMELRIMGPDGTPVYRGDSSGTPITWTMSAYTADGRYSWEVRLGTAPVQQRRTDANERVTAPPAEVVSGSFLVDGGAIVPPTTEEASLMENVISAGRYVAKTFSAFLVSTAHADQQFIDDLIVVGSQCLGQDCVNGEAFGFDTLRLKENNLRIRFTDTSNSASFPTNDWEITANDSINGGKSYLGFMDVDSSRTLLTLEAGAPANSIYVHSTGRVGMGTSLPLMKLHMADGDTPTIRLDQDGTSGWSPQRWDIAGNETNFFIRDATNASSLPLRIFTAAPTNSLVVAENGNIGLGEPSPTHNLHVAGNALITGNLELSSSRELKDNIEFLETSEAIETMASLQPVTFQYKSDPSETSVGFIAEDVPDLVATNSRKSVSPMDVLAVVTKVVQEQQKTIADLQQEVQKLQERLRRHGTASALTFNQ